MFSGGRGGIRTHGTLAGTPVFKTGALNHSATLPSLELKHLARPAHLRKRRLPPVCPRRQSILPILFSFRAHLSHGGLNRESCPIIGLWEQMSVDRQCNGRRS